MDIFDFNIHLPYLQNDDVNIVIGQDLTMNSAQLSDGLRHHKPRLTGIQGANFLLFNTSLLDESMDAFQKELKSTCSIFYLTALVDFRRSDVNAYLHRAKEAGMNAIMFNSYLQKIGEEDFKTVLDTCYAAEKLGLIICVDGSYGTSKMFLYNNCKLSCYIADAISKVPVVIVHSGGYNVLRAMLLALDKKNVWLDTSFSLPYYIDSSLEIDFAFAYKKMNYERIVFGSDHPYMDMATTIAVHQDFFNKHDFPQSAIDNIFYHNALSLFNRD